MSKQFIHNLDDGNYYVIDSQREQKARVTPFGEQVSHFQLHTTGFKKGSERGISLSHRDKLTYTPHQNKFYGYCQFPNQKLNEDKLTESRMTSLKQKLSTRSVTKSINTTCEMNGKCINTKISEFLFPQDDSHLTANLRDVIENLEKSTIQTYQFRKGCTKLLNRKELQTRDHSQRFVSKYINHRQIKSPPVPLINKFIINSEQQKLQQEQSKQTEQNKITLATDRGRIAVVEEDFEDRQPRSLSKSLYQTLDVSLQLETMERNCMKTITSDHNAILSKINQQVSDIYQSFSFPSKMYCQQQLITAKSQMENASQLDRDLDLYPDLKRPKEYKKPKQYRTKLQTEHELKKRDKDLNTNYLL